MALLDKFLELDMDMENLNIVYKSKEGEEHYWCTPIGAYIFASTGCDGVSFCIIPREGDKELENSPVYILSPTDSCLVEWVARNFHDFLRLTLLFKTAWVSAVVSELYSLSAEEFEAAIDERNLEIKEWDKSEQKQINKAIMAIQSILPKTTVKYDYDYFIACYNNKENHFDLCFNDDAKIYCYKLGCYCEHEEDEL